MSKESDKVLEASIGMAIVDALPVLCFSASMILIGQIYQSAVFMVGAILCVLAGVGKVLWKLILAIAHKDVPILFRQFRFLMPAGFVQMIVSLVINRPSLSALWKNVSSFPCRTIIMSMRLRSIKRTFTLKKLNTDEEAAASDDDIPVTLSGI